MIDGLIWSMISRLINWYGIIVKKRRGKQHFAILLLSCNRWMVRLRSHPVDHSSGGWVNHGLSGRIEIHKQHFLHIVRTSTRVWMYVLFFLTEKRHVVVRWTWQPVVEQMLVGANSVWRNHYCEINTPGVVLRVWCIRKRNNWTYACAAERERRREIGDGVFTK